jgi:hypothetical protein
MTLRKNVMGSRILMLPAGVVLITALTLTADSVQGQLGDPCERCKPKTAHWQWKANGYAVGASPASAETSAKQAALQSACEQSKKYLAPRKLTCRPGCTPGEISESCSPSKPPECLTGTYADNRGMWQFVCRKMHGKQALSHCGDDAAKEQPGYGMCDTSVTAQKTRSCAPPGCPKP